MVTVKYSPAGRKCNQPINLTNSAKFGWRVLSIKCCYCNLASEASQKHCIKRTLCWPLVRLIKGGVHAPHLWKSQGGGGSGPPVTVSNPTSENFKGGGRPPVSPLDPCMHTMYNTCTCIYLCMLYILKIDIFCWIASCTCTYSAGLLCGENPFRNNFFPML
jgi:hypothetical protein